MYGSASELRATLEYDFSQEKDFGDAKVDIQDEKVDIESVLSEKSSDFSVKTTVHNHRLFEKFGFDEVFGRSAVMELLELKSSGASKLLANLTQAEIIEPVSGHGKGKYKFGNRHFWCRGYYVDTVGKNAKKIQEYIQNQLKEDYEYDQMTLRLANHFDESLDSSAGKKPL